MVVGDVDFWDDVEDWLAWAVVFVLAIAIGIVLLALLAAVIALPFAIAALVFEGIVRLWEIVR